MRSKHFIAYGFVVMSIFATLTNLFAQQINDKDQAILDQLKIAGSDLTKPHNIEFFLYYPTEDIAKKASHEIEKEGVTVSVRKSAKEESWLCFGTKRMIPTHQELNRLRKIFEGISKRFKGDYDGWGTEVVKADSLFVWPVLPKIGFISGRSATEQDVKDGDAVFCASRDGQVIGKPISIEIPQYAYWKDEQSGKRFRVIIIQAELADDKELIGYKNIETGEFGAGLKREFELLGIKP